MRTPSRISLSSPRPRLSRDGALPWGRSPYSMMKLTVVGVAIAIGLVLAFGLYLFGVGLRNVSRAEASSRWPRTAGKVGRSDTKVQHDVDKKTRDVSVIYSADTVIQYEVAGKHYATNLIHFGRSEEHTSELQSLRH